MTARQVRHQGCCPSPNFQYTCRGETGYALSIKTFNRIFNYNQINFICHSLNIWAKEKFYFRLKFAGFHVSFVKEHLYIILLFEITTVYDCFSNIGKWKNRTFENYKHLLISFKVDR